ncbi:MAG: DUF3943 domain-containing protein [Ginsengibacter sp.]
MAGQRIPGYRPFAIEGSLMWEYFGENTQLSKNDIINTPISGMFLGEVLYRISSNVLDDRARGVNRFWRELIAGILDPPRALNRLTQGKMFRVTNKEVYQKEPLNITLSGYFIRLTGIINLAQVLPIIISISNWTMAILLK